MDKKIISQAMAELDEETLKEQLKTVVSDGGTGAMDTVEALREGMDEVGRLFEEGEYFVGDLIYAGEIMTDAVEVLKPFIGDGSGKKLGKLLIATVKDDLHDIGKNIVKALLEAADFEVVDMGVDNAPEDIVKRAQEENVSVVALSGVLTVALDSMKQTVEAFNAAGIRDSVHIIIGGAPVSEAACSRTGADEWAVSPQKTVAVCRNWMGA